jgi:hypothetical protein
MFLLRYLLSIIILLKFHFLFLGTRYPSGSDILSFKNLAKKFRKTNVPGFEWMKHWVGAILFVIVKHINFLSYLL